MMKVVLSLALVAGVLFEVVVADEVDSCDPPPKCKKNEYWDKCPDCNKQTCCSVGQKPLPCPAVCIPACRCIKGHVRDNNGDCVPIEYCSKCKNPNEVYDTCPGCHPQTCETRDQVYNCGPRPCEKDCKPACRCKNGYYRNLKGECISAENCAKCPNDHEYWSCGPACDNRCDSKYGQDNCNIVNIKCNEKCYCEKGYARATNETCIPKEDCQYECPKNEEYSACPDRLCIPKKCTDAGYPLNCTEVKEGCPCPGKPGCVCKFGYLRNCKGVCVPSKECPSCGGDDNAIPGCGTNCGRHCYDLKSDKPANCVPMCYPNGCECKPDYVFDDNIKKCVKPCDCTPVCKENEQWSTCANGICRKTCKDIDKPNVCKIPDKCKGGCICADGYLRNSKGKCVPEKDCDHCPKNERYELCPSSICEPKTCAEAGFPLNCKPRKDGEPCCGKPGCICDTGYLRDCNGVCIPSKDCPSCGGDKNATYGCGVNCGRLCSNYKCKDVACIQVCYPNSCDCQPDYVYDSNTKKCVLPCDCTPVCKKNEVYTTCVGAVCRQTCEDQNKPENCPRPKCCKDGCVCDKGYLRDKNGVCIPIEKCPKC